jgi:hypothetical protein
MVAASTVHADPPKLTTLGKTAFALELPAKWTIDASTPDLFLLRSPARDRVVAVLIKPSWRDSWMLKEDPSLDDNARGLGCAAGQATKRLTKAKTLYVRCETNIIVKDKTVHGTASEAWAFAGKAWALCSYSTVEASDPSLAICESFRARL